MKKFILLIFLFISTNLYAYTPRYEYANRHQRAEIEKGIYSYINLISVHGCNINIEIKDPSSFMKYFSNDRHLDIALSWTKNKNIIRKNYNNINYENFHKAMYEITMDYDKCIN